MTLKLRKLAYDSPPEFPDENRRLEDLYALKILDTAADTRFDRYTDLLTAVFRTPIALITFVDEDRQWFKSACGLSVSETPREVSFCAHAIATGDLLVVHDARRDPRFSGHPAVLEEPHVRFYAGAVLKGPSGQPVGTCCIVDHEPRAFSPEDVKALRQVAQLVQYELELSLETTDLRRKIMNAALLDSSTGLPNLANFSEQLANLISLSESPCLLGLIRFERFDALEAATGRGPASFLMRKLVERLEESATPPSIIGLVREDKLGIVVDMGSASTPESILDEILGCVESPFFLDDHTVDARISVGASVYPRDGKTVETLLKRARTALWSIPHVEQSAYRLFRRRQSNAAMRHFRLESALKQALERDEFHLVYQPKSDLKTGRIVGAEVLLRWHSMEFGEVPPGRFIPVAESSGLIGEIGDWVLDRACGQLATWIRTGAGCPTISVNIASGQLRHPAFVARVAGLREQYQLGAGQLELELTESSLVSDIGEAVKIMRHMVRQGIVFAIDDFGTGFSSLNYLRQMPLQTLKIDRSFIGHIPSSAEDMRLTRSIVSMGHSLGLTVIAEGVETKEQLDFLRGIGCDQIQGFLLGRPLRASEFAKFCSDS